MPEHHEDPAYWRDLAMRWERRAMANLERAKDAEAVATLAVSMVEAMKARPMVNPEMARQAAHRLLTIPYLYGGYTVNCRGPRGCIYEALGLLAPDVRDAWDELGAHEAYQRFFAEDADG
jgi:hypothetical protein